MEMHQGPSMQLEMAVIQAQEDIKELRADLADVLEFIKGNGDPTKGLLWLVADVGRLAAAQAELLGAHRQELERHKAEGHYTRQGPWVRMGFDIAKSVTVWIVIGFLAIFVAGLRFQLGVTP